MAEKDCLNNENELNSSIIGSNEVQSQLNIDNLSSELGENSDISSVLAIDDINSEMNPDLSTDSNLNEHNQVESELDVPITVQGELPEIPTKLSEFENDVGFITLEDIPEYPENLSDFNNDVGFITKKDLPELPDTSNLVDKSELNNYVSKEELSQEGFLKEIPEEYITQEELDSSISNKANKDEIPDISGKVDKSELLNYVTNDSLEEKGYLSSIPDEYVTEQELTDKNYATITDLGDSETKTLNSANTYTDTKVAELIDSAPETLDTFKEIADAFAEDQEVLDTLNSAIGLKADKTALTETNLRVASLEENKADKSEIPDISGKADKSELSNYITNTALENKGYLTEIPTEYVTESELTAKDYATNTSVSSKYLPLSGGTLTGAVNLNGGYPQIKTNQPDFVIQTQGGKQYDFTDTEFRPTASNVDTLNIGKSDRRFKNIYLSGNANIKGGQIVRGNTLAKGAYNSSYSYIRHYENKSGSNQAYIRLGHTTAGTGVIQLSHSPSSSSNDVSVATTNWVRDSIDITGVKTDMITLVKGLINTSDYAKSAKYARWICKINGVAATDTAAATGSYTIANIPLNVAFTCEAICNRLASATDYGYQLRFVAAGTHIIYRTYVSQSSTSLTWYQDVMTVGNQTIAGNKTFSGTVSANSLTGNAVYNRASVNALTAAATWANNSKVPTLTTLAYWDGRYQTTNNASNLKYAVTPSSTDNNNRIATTAWVKDTLHRHTIYLVNDALRLLVVLIDNRSSKHTITSFRSWLHNAGYTATDLNGAFYPSIGGTKTGYSSVYGIASNGTASTSSNFCIFYQLDNGTTKTTSYNFTTLTDTVENIFDKTVLT